MSNLNNKQKLRTFARLVDRLTQHLDQAEALLFVALQNDKFFELPTAIQENFMLVVNEKFCHVSETHSEIKLFCKQNSLDSVCG